MTEFNLSKKIVPLHRKLNPAWIHKDHVREFIQKLMERGFDLSFAQLRRLKELAGSELVGNSGTEALDSSGTESGTSDKK